MSYLYSTQGPMIAKKTSHTSQTSQIVSPVPVHMINHPVLRASFTERSSQDQRNYAIQSTITRQGSVKHIYDGYKVEQGPQQKYANSQCQKTFSDYQINLANVKGEDSQLPTGGGYNIIGHKINDKFKGKAQMQKVSSKINLENSKKSSLLKTFDSAYEVDKGEYLKSDELTEWLTSEMSKLVERMNRNEQKVENIEKNYKKCQQMSNLSFNPRLDEINKILSFAQKSQNRDDYRKTMKMMDQLRGNILQLNSEIKEIQIKFQGLPVQNNVDLETQIQSQIQMYLKNGAMEIKKNTNKDSPDVIKKLSQLEDKWREWKRQHDDKWSHINSGVKKFQGKMITFLYEEKITHLSQSSATSNILNKVPLKGTEIFSNDKQNSCSAVISSRVYYLDSEGYLLDKNKYYLLNKKNQQIKLSQKELELLKRHNLI